MSEKCLPIGGNRFSMCASHKVALSDIVVSTDRGTFAFRMPMLAPESLKMKRRDLAFIFLGGAALWPLRIHAQRATNRMPRIGVLLPGTPASFSIRAKAFLDALSKLGRVEGGTVEIEWKWANDRVDGFARTCS
jgi:hypothetical protein